MKKEDTSTFKYELPLPKYYREVKNKIYLAKTNYYESLKENYLQKYASEIFPNGKGAQKIMYESVVYSGGMTFSLALLPKYDNIPVHRLKDLTVTPVIIY